MRSGMCADRRQCGNLKSSMISVLGAIHSLTSHRPLTKGRITQQSSPERDESNAFNKNVFLASTEDNNLGTEQKFELIWSDG
jgi:hypothetical protein